MSFQPSRHNQEFAHHLKYLSSSSWKLERSPKSRCNANGSRTEKLRSTELLPPVIRKANARIRAQKISERNRFLFEKAIMKQMLRPPWKLEALEGLTGECRILRHSLISTACFAFLKCAHQLARRQNPVRRSHPLSDFSKDASRIASNERD
jgi:hypothetical protein